MLQREESLIIPQKQSDSGIMWWYGGSVYSNPTRFCNQGTITRIKFQPYSVIRLNIGHKNRQLVCKFPAVDLTTLHQ